MSSKAPPTKITIRYDGEEYRVPSAQGQDHEPSAYYTNDLRDALMTCMSMNPTAIYVKTKRVVALTKEAV